MRVDVDATAQPGIPQAAQFFWNSFPSKCVNVSATGKLNHGSVPS